MMNPRIKFESDNYVWIQEVNLKPTSEFESENSIWIQEVKFLPPCLKARSGMVIGCFSVPRRGRPEGLRREPPPRPILANPGSSVLRGLHNFLKIDLHCVCCFCLCLLQGPEIMEKWHPNSIQYRWKIIAASLPKNVLNNVYKITCLSSFLQRSMCLKCNA